MKVLFALLCLVGLLAVTGCTSTADEAQTKVNGKVPVKETPAGTVPPGDVRPPKDGKTTDEGARG